VHLFRNSNGKMAELDTYANPTPPSTTRYGVPTIEQPVVA
jgi:hypothetical protein